MHLPHLLFAWWLGGAIPALAQSYVFTPWAGMSSYGAVDGVGSEARFAFPFDVAVDGGGNVFVADSRNYTIRKITPAGVVTTIAGAAGLSGHVDGVGAAARFRSMQGLTIDASGTLYVADSATVRKVSAAGVVTTLAGDPGQWGSADGLGSAARFAMASDVAVDSAGIVYVADADNGTVRRITPAGEVTTLAGVARLLGTILGPDPVDGTGSAARFTSPRRLAIDSADNIYVADSGPNGVVRKITPTGVVTTIRSGVAPWAIAVDRAGNLYLTSTEPWDLSILGVIYKLTPIGVLIELAGALFQSGSEDGVGAAARFASPCGLAVDDQGNVYVADISNSAIRKITPDGVVSTLAGLAPRSVDGIAGVGRFWQVGGTAVDRDGNVFVIDYHGAIRKVTAEGVVTTLAGSPDERGAADGVGSAARFNFPRDLTVDDAGNVFVADSGNYTVRKITPQGVVTTLAGAVGRSGNVDGNGGLAQFGFLLSVAVDRAGNVYVAEFNAVRRIRPNGDVTTIAGVVGQSGSTDGVGSAARFGGSLDLVVDARGSIIATDYENSSIRSITPDGVVTTVAGAAGRIGRIIDGPAESARFYYPRHMAIDSAGSVLAVDSNNGVIRKINHGVVSTLSTNLPAIDFETRVAVDAAGNLYVTDSLRQTIFKGSLLPSVDLRTRLGNLSVRANLQAQEPLVVGVAVRGTKPVLLRGIGPGLQPFLPNVRLAGDPRLDVFDASGALIAANDDWGGERELSDAFASAGAFPLPMASADAALLRNIGGQLTVHIVAPANGVGLIELFDLGPQSATGFANLSARHRAGGSEQTALVAGFTIEGGAEKTVLIRGIGPALRAAPFHVGEALADPMLTIFNRAGLMFAHNNDAPSILTNAFARVGAFPLAAESKDAALMLTLPPGIYSAALSSADGGIGEAMIEIYDVP